MDWASTKIFAERKSADSLQTHLELLIWAGRRIRVPRLSHLAMPAQLSALHCVCTIARDTENSWMCEVSCLLWKALVAGWNDST